MERLFFMERKSSLCEAGQKRRVFGVILMDKYAEPAVITQELAPRSWNSYLFLQDSLFMHYQLPKLKPDRRIHNHHDS